MKKIITSIIALIFVVCLTFGLSGCNNEPPKEPVIKNETDPWFEWNFTKFDPQCNWWYDITEYDVYLDYINNEYRKVCNETFVIWTPVVEDNYEGTYNSEGYAYVYNFKNMSLAAAKNKITGKCTGTNAKQYVCVIPEEWNGEDWKSNLNGPEVFRMTVVSAAVKVDDVNGEFEVKIYEGEQYNERINVYDVYANVYIGETCVATCFARSLSKYCSKNWIENYIKTHLMISSVN